MKHIVIFFGDLFVLEDNYKNRHEFKCERLFNVAQNYLFCRIFLKNLDFK